MVGDLGEAPSPHTGYPVLPKPSPMYFGKQDVAMHSRRPATTAPIAYLRLLGGALSAALAALAVLKPQNWPMVMLTLGTTEWGHLVALAALAALLPGWRRHRASRLGGALGLVALVLSLSALLRAAWLARRLPTRVVDAFGAVAPRSAPGAPARPAPLVALDVLRGIQSPRVRKSRVTYVIRDKLPLQLDLYQPAAARGAAPCLMVIHGGSWQSGDSSQIPRLNSYLAARGYVVAAISYRLAPEHRYPAARDDVLAALTYLKVNAASLGLDPRQFALLGRSAGAQLALLVAYTAKDPAIRGVISFYGPVDLVYGHQHPAKKSILDSVAVIESYLGGSPATMPEVYAAASPITFAGPASPPTLLIHGDRDTLVAPFQSAMLAARLAEANCQHMLLRLPWAEHACDANLSGPSGQLSTYAIERFLAAVTRD
jgi:acetyl esterase/lipase